MPPRVNICAFCSYCAGTDATVNMALRSLLGAASAAASGGSAAAASAGRSSAAASAVSAAGSAAAVRDCLPGRVPL